PGIRLADKTLHGVTCIRLDATVTLAHSDKELAEAGYKGYGHHPLLAGCDNTGGDARGGGLGRRPAAAISRCWRAAITPAGSRWPGCCAAARRARTRPRITWCCWTRRSPRCRPPS